MVEANQAEIAEAVADGGSGGTGEVEEEQPRPSNVQDGGVLTENIEASAASGEESKETTAAE